jgi:hypothetical protein
VDARDADIAEAYAREFMIAVETTGDPQGPQTIPWRPLVTPWRPQVVYRKPQVVSWRPQVFPGRPQTHVPCWKQTLVDAGGGTLPAMDLDWECMCPTYLEMHAPHLTGNECAQSSWECMYTMELGKHPPNLIGNACSHFEVLEVTQMEP